MVVQKEKRGNKKHQLIIKARMPCQLQKVMQTLSQILKIS